MMNRERATMMMANVDSVVEKVLLAFPKSRGQILQQREKIHGNFPRGFRKFFFVELLTFSASSREEQRERSMFAILETML